MNLARTLFTPPNRLATQRAALPDNLRQTQVGTTYVSGYSQVGGSMISEWDADAAVRQAYLANVFVYACVTIIANTIASLPLRAGKNPDKPQEFDLDAPLARLLGPPPGSPSRDTTPSQLWAHSIAQRLVTGRFGWELEWSGKPGNSELIALYPLISRFIEPVPPAKGQQSATWFVKYAYDANGERKTFETNEIFYDWKPSLTSWHQPESALQAARLNISGAVMQDIYDYSFLKNDSRPAALVVTEHWESQEHRERFQAKFDAKFRGPGNAGKMLFTEVGDNRSTHPISQMVDIKNLGLSHKDADTVNRYSGNIKAIVAGLGVPMSKLDASGRTFDNASEEDKTWWVSRLLPLVRELQEAINVRLAPLVGDEVCWFDLSEVEVLKKAKAYNPDQARDAYDEDAITKNEYREVLGEEAIEGGDKFKSEFAPEPQPEPIPDENQNTPETPSTQQEDPEPEGTDLSQPDERSLPGLNMSRHMLGLVPAEPTRQSDAPSTGVMVAFWLTPEQSHELVVDGGEPSNELHVTLAYLGKVSDGIDQGKLLRAVERFAANHDPVVGTISGKGMFNTPDGIAVVGLVDAPGLGEFRVELVKALADEGLSVRTDHDFTPHVTLAYVQTQEEADAIKVPANISIGWQQVAISYGEQDTFFELGTELERRRAAERREMQWRLLDAQLEGLEAPWVRSFQSLFRRQEEAVISRLTGKNGRRMMKRAEDEPIPDTNLLFDLIFWIKETFEQCLSLFEGVIAFAGNRLIDKFGLGFDIQAPNIQEVVRSRSIKLAEQVSETTHSQIQEALIAGIEAGESIDEIAKRIREVFANADKNRSVLIARTEVISSYNQATYEAGLAYGDDVVGGKEWLSAHDDRVRSTHKGADGQERGITEDFLVGGFPMAFPGDGSRAPASEVIACRCTTALIPADEWQRSRKARQWRAVEEVEAELVRIALEGVF